MRPSLSGFLRPLLVWNPEPGSLIQTEHPAHSPEGWLMHVDLKTSPRGPNTPIIEVLGRNDKSVMGFRTLKHPYSHLERFKF